MKNIELDSFKKLNNLPILLKCDCGKIVKKEKCIIGLPIGIITGITRALYCPYCDNCITKYIK